MLSARRDRARNAGTAEGKGAEPSLPPAAAERDLISFLCGIDHVMTTLSHRSDGKRAIHPLWNRSGGGMGTDRSLW